MKKQFGSYLQEDYLNGKKDGIDIGALQKQIEMIINMYHDNLDLNLFNLKNFFS